MKLFFALSLCWYFIPIALCAAAAMIFCTRKLFFALKTEDDKNSGRYWYLALVTLSITVSLTYCVLHIIPDKLNAGCKRIEYLNKTQTETLFTLMDNLPEAKPGSTNTLTAPNTTTAPAAGTASKDTGKKPTSPTTISPSKTEIDTAKKTADTTSKSTANALSDVSKKKIIDFFRITFPDVVPDSAFKATMDNFSLPELKVILPKYPIQLRSYFWLYQNWVYFEIIFWCIFGVLANLLYYSSETLRDGKFLRQEIYTQFAKVIYSPFCVIIIYICYNKIQSSEVEGDIQYSIYSIVISFLLGFFSGRMIELLGRLKDVFLPSSRTATAPSNSTQTQQDKPDDISYDESLNTNPQTLG